MSLRPGVSFKAGVRRVPRTNEATQTKQGSATVTATRTAAVRRNDGHVVLNLVKGNATIAD